MLVIADDAREALKFVDMDAGEVLGSLELSGKVVALAMDSAASRAFLLDDDGRLHVVAISTRTRVGMFALGGKPKALLLREESGSVVEVLIAEQAPDRLRGIDPASGATLRSVAIEREPASLAWGQAGSRLLVGARDGRLLALDATDLALLSTTRIGDEIRGLSWWDAGSLAIAVHKRADGVSLVDVESGQISTFVALDGDPELGAVDAELARLYIATRHDFSVNRVDLLRRALDGRYALPEKASGVVFDAAARRLIVSQRKDRRILRIDPDLASLISAFVLNKHLRDIAVNDATHEAVAVADGADELTRIRLSDRSVATAELPARARYVAVDTALNLAVVGLKNKDLRFVDLAPAPGPVLLAERVRLPDEPDALAVDSSRGLSVVLTDSRRKIHFVDNARRTLVSSISLKEDVDALAIHAVRGLAYVLADKKKLLLLDLGTRSIVQETALEFRGNAIAVSEALDRAVITSDHDNKAYVLDLATLGGRRELAAAGFAQVHVLPKRPGAVAINPDTGLAVVASSESGLLSSIDLHTGALAAGFVSLDKPFALAMTSRYNQALVLSSERDEVAFVQLPNPVPALTALQPSEASAGHPALVLALSGRHFVDSSRAHFGTAALATRWVSHTRLEADVPPGLMAAAGSVFVTVKSPPPAGGSSNALEFAIGGGAPPVLARLDPDTAFADGAAKLVNISGQNFRPGALVRFGAAELPASVHGAAALTVVIPGTLTQAPGTLQVSVANTDGKVSNSLPFTLTPLLAITSLEPASARIGTAVAIRGSGFDPNPAGNALTFTGRDNGTVPATALSASATRIVVNVPPQAETGPITLTNSLGTVHSPTFTVIREQDFRVVASPAGLTVYQSASNSAQVQLASVGAQAFTGLATLTVQGLPAGVTASFTPAPTLSAAQTATLTFGAASGAASSAIPISIRAEAVASGEVLVRTALLNVTVASSAALTGVKGRFITPERAGIAGVIVRADLTPDNQPQTTTDAAGNFQLVGLPGGAVTLRFDATPANPLYPIWPYTTTLAANQIAVIPDWTIHPPPSDDKFVPIANGGQEQVVTDARFPGVKVVLPAGSSIVGWDGVVKTRIAIEKVDLTRMPVTPPPVPVREAYQLFFGTPMGGLPSTPIPVSVPNVTGLEPGEQTEIWYFDGSPMGGSGEWKSAGAATISADGATVVSNPDAGIPRFCGVCGLFAARCPALPSGNPTSREGCKSGNPVDLLSGYEMPSYGGLTCGGLVPREIGLSYNPVDGFQGRGGLEGAVGQGWVLDYDIVLADSLQVPQSKRLILPPNDRINFVRQADNVSYVAEGDLRFDGAVLRRASGAGYDWELTFRDRRRLRFGLTDSIFLTASFLVEQVDPLGNVTRVERRAGDRKITRIGDDERAYQFTYGASSLVEEIRDPADRALRFTYNASRRIETMTDADGRITRYTYVGDDEFPPSAVCTQGTDGLRIKTIEYPGRPNPTVNQHGASRRVLRQVDPGGVERKFEYKVAGACVVHQSSPGVRCAGATCPDTDSWENFQAGWRIYGGQVLATTTVDAGGRRTRNFNASGLSTATVDGLGQATKLVRDGNNRVTERTDALNRTSKYQYDAKGNVTQVTDPLGRVTRLTYHATSNKVTSITRFDEAGDSQTWQFAYDEANGTLLTATNPLGQTMSFAYTPRGELAQVSDALAHATQFAYNAAGDLTQITDALGNVTGFGSDGAGRRISSTDPLGFITGTRYNGIDRVTQVTDARGKSTLLDYDAAGRLASVTNARGFAIESYGYDAGDRLLSRTDAKLRASAYTYDAAGRLATLTDRRGQVSAFAYDAQDRVTTITRPEGVTRFTYDALGRLSEVADPAGSVSYGYDLVDRLVSEVQLAGGLRTEVTYAYDALDRRIRRTVNGVADESTTYGYDRANRLTSIGYRGQTTSFEYDAAGRLVRKVLPNGLIQALGYDAADRLLSIVYGKPDNTLIESIAYDYDANGRRVSETKSVNPALETAFSALYDEADRMTSITLSATGQTFLLAYDDDGNLAAKTEQGGAGALTTYTWDSRNRLTAIGAPGLEASFEYDALGRRTARTVNGETTRYVYDGLQAIAEIRGSGTDTLLTGLGLDEVIARYSGAGARTYLTDALNTVLAQTREDQSVQNYYAYSAYGETTTLGPDEGNPLQYTGRENDGTGLYYYRARYYDPVLKRFVSEDPIGLRGGINVASYVGGNPVSFADPEGLLTITGGGSVRIPSWIKHIIPGYIGQGGGFGMAIQLTRNGKFCPDLGVFWTGNAGGEDYGIGRASINLGLQADGIAELAGRGFDYSGHWGLVGGTANFDWDGNFTGGQFNYGPGYNFGASGSISGSWSFRGGLNTPTSTPNKCGCP
ncbi:MAG: RHS repeat-associated core domain-containing protein [Phycisphaeraceae bacterium]